MWAWQTGRQAAGIAELRVGARQRKAAADCLCVLRLVTASSCTRLLHLLESQGARSCCACCSPRLLPSTATWSA